MLFFGTVIRSFADKDTEALWDGEEVKAFRSFRPSAERKLGMLNAATSLKDLSQISGNRLEALKGNRQGQYSIRINSQWRLCFRWESTDALDVAIVDYH